MKSESTFENQDNEPEESENKKFIVERFERQSQRYPDERGFIYEIYFSSEEEAEKAVKDFWNEHKNRTMVAKGLESGILKPFKHEITGGDRTSPRINRSKKHPDKLFVVQFNGNTGALSPNGEDTLRQIGFI